MNLRKRIGTFVEGTKVQTLITILIVLNAASLGLETVPDVVERIGPALHIFDVLVIGVYVLEISAKLIYRPVGFFRNGWNIFDFVIVSVTLIATSQEISVLRALRILRTLRLFTVVPEMRLIVQALLAAAPGILAVVPIILIIFYVGAVLTTNLYGSASPIYFETIQKSMYTLFQIMTLDDWSNGIVRPLLEQHPFAWVFFVTFIIIISFTMLNMFVGVIVDSILTQRELERAANTTSASIDRSSLSRDAQHGIVAADNELKEIAIEIRALRQDFASLRAAVGGSRSD